MTLAFIVYLISVLESIKAFFITLSLFFALVAFVAVTPAMGYPSKPIKRKLLIYSLLVGFLSFGFGLVIPSEKSGYAIAAAYTTQIIAESPQAQEIGGKLLKVINGKLDETIKDQEGSKK